MAGEHSSGIKFAENDNIKGYVILKAFDPGGFAFAGKAKSPSGRTVFFKKYKRPGGAAPWYQGFVTYQTELKRLIQSNPAAKSLCYEFIEFFEMTKLGGAMPLRAFYQVFEWVEGGKDLKKVVEEIETHSSAVPWDQRVVFAKVMVAGINALHRAGIIHSDLKPENFYLLPDSTVEAKFKLRVIDMDFSIIEGRKAPWDGVEGYVGTPGYLSPEHLTPNSVPKKASDVFTMALILGQLLGDGHPAGKKMDQYDELVKTAKLTPVVIRQPIPRVPDLQFLNTVINSALRLDSTKRPTAQQLLEALSGQLAEWEGKRPRQSIPASPVAAPSHPAATHTPPVPSTPRVAPPATPTPAPAVVLPSLEVHGPTGQTLVFKVTSTIGRGNFSAWGPDYAKFMSTEQFRVFRNESKQWMIDHCVSASNATSANGTKITAAIPITDGMVIALGQTGKCPLKLMIKN